MSRGFLLEKSTGLPAAIHPSTTVQHSTVDNNPAAKFCAQQTTT
jgi:hypothetical protein